MSNPRTRLRALIYMGYYPAMQKAASKHKYALALHGSLNRDCDIIAVPWHRDASSAAALIDSLVKIVGGELDKQDEPYMGQKPFGRMPYIIHMKDGAFFDISVMPRIVPASYGECLKFPDCGCYVACADKNTPEFCYGIDNK